MNKKIESKILINKDILAKLEIQNFLIFIIININIHTVLLSCYNLTILVNFWGFYEGI